MFRSILRSTLIVSAVFLSACTDDSVSELPPPAKLTMDAMGYFCNMTVKDHAGSKGQIILKKDEDVLWFASVRDTVAFTRMPGEPREIAAIYVSDMSNVEDWSAPNLETWVEASKAFFVIGSTKKGGMGAPEPVPFASQDIAKSFAQEFGGKVVALSDIPDNMVLGTSDMEIETSELSSNLSEEVQK